MIVVVYVHMLHMCEFLFTEPVNPGIQEETAMQSPRNTITDNRRGAQHSIPSGYSERRRRW